MTSFSLSVAWFPCFFPSCGVLIWPLRWNLLLSSSRGAARTVRQRPWRPTSSTRIAFKEHPAEHVAAVFWPKKWLKENTWEQLSVNQRTWEHMLFLNWWKLWDCASRKLRDCVFPLDYSEDGNIREPFLNNAFFRNGKRRMFPLERGLPWTSKPFCWVLVHPCPCIWGGHQHLASRTGLLVTPGGFMSRNGCLIRRRVGPALRDLAAWWSNVNPNRMQCPLPSSGWAFPNPMFNVEKTIKEVGWTQLGLTCAYPEQKRTKSGLSDAERSDAGGLRSEQFHPCA